MFPMHRNPVITRLPNPPQSYPNYEYCASKIADFLSGLNHGEIMSSKPLFDIDFSVSYDYDLWLVDDIPTIVVTGEIPRVARDQLIAMTEAFFPVYFAADTYIFTALPPDDPAIPFYEVLSVDIVSILQGFDAYDVCCYQSNHGATIVVGADVTHRTEMAIISIVEDSGSQLNVFFTSPPELFQLSEMVEFDDFEYLVDKD